MTRVTYVRLVAAMIVVAAVSSIFLLQFEWFGDAGSEGSPGTELEFAL